MSSAERVGTPATPQVRVNVGCGTTPTPGWLNVDNSPAVRIAALPGPIRSFVGRFVGAQSREFITVAAAHGITWADSARRLPLESGTAEVVYSSHMLKHLDRVEALSFLSEAMRVLVPRGYLRLALPDLHKLTDEYISSGDADVYLEAMHTCMNRPRKWADRFRYAVVGPRQHHWMYDPASIGRLLVASGFVDVEHHPPGKTGIPNPGLLDLSEREQDSLFVEARKPARPQGKDVRTGME
jgi:predicted SAM-dependent methyltransferase